VSNIEFTTRYGKGPSPDLETMCQGQCEGLGRVPIDEDDMEEPWRSLWLQAEAQNPKGGYHFVKCPDCNGTGKKQ
jgi:hypothetical protein